MSDDRLLWEQQVGESRQAFDAFRRYRDLGPSRSVVKVVQEWGEGKPKSKSLLDRWCKRWNWVQRADSWDRNLDAEHRASLVEEAREMGRRHAQIAMLFQSKAVERLNTLNASRLTPSELIKMVDVAVKVERQARGLDDPARFVLEGNPDRPLKVEVVYEGPDEWRPRSSVEDEGGFVTPLRLAE